jgi:hypothetical protein
MKTKIVAISGKYRFSRQAAGQVVEHFHRHLEAPRALPQAFGDVEHHPDRDADREQQVQNALVERDRPRLEPGVEFELVRRRVDAAGDCGRLVRGDAEQDHEHDDPADPGAEDRPDDLAFCAHAVLLRRSSRTGCDRRGARDGAHCSGPSGGRPLAKRTMNAIE